MAVTGLLGGWLSVTLMSAANHPAPVTVCVSTGDVLLAYKVRLKTAVIEWLPAVRALVVKAAVPLETAPVPMVVAPQVGGRSPVAWLEARLVTPSERTHIFRP